MKQAIYIIAALAIGFTSCQKVIDVNIDDAPPKVVIEAEINEGEPVYVHLSRSIELDKNNNFPHISGANIILTDDAGNSDTLTEDNLNDDEYYIGYNIIGRPGRTYILTVAVDGETYTAVSTMPQRIELDSVTARAFSGFGDPIDFLVIHYNDPQKKGDYVRAKVWVNNWLVPDLFLEDDNFVNGNYNAATLFSGEYELADGDDIIVELNTLDKAVYDYYVELEEVSGSSQVASPSNPVTNISGGALGYFSAHTTSIGTLRYIK